MVYFSTSFSVKKYDGYLFSFDSLFCRFVLYEVTLVSHMSECCRNISIVLLWSQIVFGIAPVDVRYPTCIHFVSVVVLPRFHLIPEAEAPYLILCGRMRSMKVFSRGCCQQKPSF